MDSLRLARIAPPGLPGEWPIPAGRTSIVGRAHPRSRTPDIDLWPDPALSRRHAAVWIEAGRGWIRDLGSRAGTAVDGAVLSPETPARLEPGMLISMAATRLLVLPAGARVLRLDGGSCLEVGASVPLGYSLAQHAWAPFDRFVLHNPLAEPSPAQSLTLALAPYAVVRLSLPALAAGERRSISLADVHIDQDALAAVTERRWMDWRVEAAGTPLALDSPIGTWVLAPDEFTFEPRLRITLAAFVQPNHPRVAHVASVAGLGHGPRADPAEMLRAVYEHLRSSWFLTYRVEPPRFAADTQRLRLAHDVLTDLHQHTGHGTCLDLAVLIAGICECLGMQPLIAIVDLGTTHHALVGCWQQHGPRLDPLPDSPSALAAQAAWIDPNGCTRDSSQQRGFDQARTDAGRILREAPFQFAVDVAAARRDGIVPLPMTGEPQWDPVTSRVLTSAHQFARAAGEQLSLVPLLGGLLAAHGSAVRDAYTQRLGDPDAAVEHLRASFARRDTAASRRKVHTVLAGAKSGANLEASPLVLERHLLAAFFDMPSRTVDEVLRALGTEREALRALLGELRAELALPASDRSTLRGT